MGAEPLHPIPEAARRLGVSRGTIYALMRSGELASVKLRGRRFVTESAIRAVIRRNTQAQLEASA